VTQANEQPLTGWHWKSLENIAVDGAPILYGILQPGPDLADGVPYVRPTEIVEDVIDVASIRRTSQAIAAKYKRSVLKPNDIILSIVGTIGKVALVPSDLDGGNITQSSVRIRVRSEIALSRYIAWALRSPVLTRQYDQLRLGTAVPRLNVAHVRSLRVPIPTLDEQQQIVAEIEKQFTRLEAGVAGLRRVQVNLKRYRAAVLKAACEGKLVPTEAELARQEGRAYETGAQLLERILAESRQKWHGKGNYKEPVKPETRILSALPKGWEWASLEQIGQSDRPIIYGIIKPGPHVSTGVPYVRVTEMKDGKIDVPNLRRTSRERAAKFARATLAPGDVLISKDGTIGRVAVVPPELAGGNITQHVMRAPINAAMFRNYVVWAIRSNGCQRWLTGETRGVALRGVNVEDFRRLPVPTPPLAEQKRIVAEVERRLSVVEELQAVVNANLQRATRLRQSILQRAFEGKLAPRYD